MSARASPPAFIPPSPTLQLDTSRKLQHPRAISLPRPPHLAQEAVGLICGLRTPPAEDMSTAYQAPLAAYESHAMHGYAQPMPQAGRAKMPMVDRANAQVYGQQPQQQATMYWPAKNQAASTVPQVPPSTQPRQPVASPSSDATFAMGQNQHSKASNIGSETLVYHSLDIPRSISPHGGNLADFSAQVSITVRRNRGPQVLVANLAHSQMTCLFWFTSADELMQAESIGTRSPTSPIARLPPLARPHEQFRKWVLSVLSTTQVTQNVILLGLLFIYRLKMSSPQVKGRAGSEYRLLVVALMLANKCAFHHLQGANHVSVASAFTD